MDISTRVPGFPPERPRTAHGVPAAFSPDAPPTSLRRGVLVLKRNGADAGLPFVLVCSDRNKRYRNKRARKFRANCVIVANTFLQICATLRKFCANPANFAQIRPIFVCFRIFVDLHPPFIYTTVCSVPITAFPVAVTHRIAASSPPVCVLFCPAHN